MSLSFRPTLTNGWRDPVIQFLLLAFALFVYQLTRGLADSVSTEQAAFANARDIVTAERALGLFVEPSIQNWALTMPRFNDFLSWMYLNAQGPVTLGGMVYIYVRHNARYYFVRNMFLVSFLIGCLGYALVPTAPPRLMPEFGFIDTVELLSGPRQFIWQAFANPYAAVPSMHIGFALMIGWSLASLATSTWARAFWWTYPSGILFIVVATGNHFWLDAVAGAFAAAVGAIAAGGLARLRPAAWSWTDPSSRAVS